MIGAYLITKGEPTTLRALESALPWVDRLIVAIDSRADRIWDRAFAGYGVESYRFDFDGLSSFARMTDDARDRAGGDWTLGLDADEVLVGGDQLRAVLDQADADGVDLVWLPRRHWLDMKATREHGSWWPDFQPRLRRPRVKMANRVHPVPIGSTKDARTSRLVLDHYNWPLRDESAWAETNALYARLAELDRGGG